ncbi:MAG: threonine/serine exporter family protein, partial [Clostridia bacterium]|nr:threonine/serine exporter family protein [Clostridia bacterium]
RCVYQTGICRAYSAEEANVAAFPSMVLASVRTSDGHEYSFMKRVYSTSNNLALLEKYNQLSRDVCSQRYPVDEALKMCFDVAHTKPRNKWVTIVGSALVAGTYSIFFGGSIIDFLPAFLVAFAMAGVNELLSTRSLNAYATTFLLSLLGGILSVSLCKLLNVIGLTVHGSLVMIGTIMILVPGLLTTNAVRDMFTGDLMSGTFQLLNGVLLTLVIAAGYGVAVLMLRSIADFVEPVARTGWQYYVYFLASGTLGAASVCMFFNLRLKRLGWAVLASAITLGLFVGLRFAFPADQVFMPIFLATLFAGLLSEVFARFIKTPATVILVPAIIAYVPGSSLYYAVQAIVEGHLDIAVTQGTVCLITLLALAVGICAATVVFRLISPVKLRFYKKNKLSEMRKAQKYGKKDKEKKHINHKHKDD